MCLTQGGVEPTQAKNGLFQRWFSGISMCFLSLTWFWITILVQLAWFEVQWSLVYLKKTQPHRTTGQLCFEIPPKHLCAVCLDPNRVAGHESHCSIWAGQSQLQGSLFVCCCWCNNDLWDVDVFCIFLFRTELACLLDVDTWSSNTRKRLHYSVRPIIDQWY